MLTDQRNRKRIIKSNMSTQVCPDCDTPGEGTCRHCHGRGKILGESDVETPCQKCNESGVCPTCDGIGMEEDEDNDREYFISKVTDGAVSYLDSPYLPHVRAVLKSVPVADLKTLAKSEAALFAIDPHFIGRVLNGRFFEGPIIYLSPALLSSEESEIRAVVAHEFAHVVLDHRENAESKEKTAYEWGRSDEEAADRLAESWGFKPPQSYTDRL